MTYKIVRFYFGKSSRTIETGLTLDQVQAHCNDPETSSETATGSKGRRLTRTHGQWFDGYTQE